MPSSALKLVLLPGMDGTGTLFRWVLPELTGDYEASVIRYPGDQTLAYPELVELVRSSLPTSQPYVLLAESFSTPVAILSAALHDPNLKALILCAGFACSPMSKWLSPFAALLTPAFSLSIPNTVSEWLLLGSSPPKPLLTAVRTAVASVKPDVLAQRLRAVAACDVREELSSISLPMLYVRGRKDRLIGRRSVREIRSVRPNAVIAEINAPHLVLQRRPRESAETVLALLHELA